MRSGSGSEDLFEFPCRLGIKAMGREGAGFAQLVEEIVAAEVGQGAILAVSTRDSRGGNYLAVTVEVVLGNRAEMEAIYATLNAHPDILMTL